MEIQSLATDNCICGRAHQIPIAQIEIGAGLLETLNSKIVSLGDFQRILLVADENTWPLAGAKLKESLSWDFQVDEVILKKGFRADEESIEKVLSAITTAPDLFLAVGSGTLTDLVRYLAASKNTPFISIPTAPSMDGYASTVAAMTLKGFKVTKPAKPPLAIFGDLEILTSAPKRMILAGAADLLGKYTALADWILAREMTGEYYCPMVSKMVAEAVVSCQEDLIARGTTDPGAIEKLMWGLIISGIGILMVGNSRPASGSEHHLSHFWELKGQLTGSEELLHGEKVAVGTVLSLAAYEFLNRQDPKSLKFDPAWRTGGLSFEEYQRELEKAYGPLAAELSVLDQRPETEKEPCDFFPKLSLALQKAKVPTRSSLEEILGIIGAPVSYKDLDLPKAWVKQGLLYGREVWERYTILTLLAQLGLSGTFAAELLEKRERLE